MCEKFGIKNVRTTPYHPQTNPVERHLPCILPEVAKRDWDKSMGDALWGYRRDPIAGIGFSPYEIMYGRRPLPPHKALKRKPGFDPKSYNVRGEK